MSGKPIAAVVVTALVLSLGAACSLFNAAPSECIRAAEDAGLPDRVVEQLRSPEGLNAVERAALQRILVQAGIDDLCDNAAEGSSTSSTADDQGGPTLETASPLRQQDDTSNTTEQNRGDAAAGTNGSPSRAGARILQDDEHRRRCQFWALNNLQPVVYGEFSKLNPDTMDDLDRILWRSQLHGNRHLGYYDDDFSRSDYMPALLPRDPGIYCRDYWAEPLRRSNANLRNQGFELQCRYDLEERTTNQYRYLADAVSYDDDNELVYLTPNQYVRILGWLDMSGDELIQSDNPPYRILQEQSQHPYAHMDNVIPTEDVMADYRRETDETLNLEWLGIVRSAGLSEGSSNLQSCHYYYPQVFYGYWVPFDPDQMPDTGQTDELDLPRYEGARTPIFLPKSVTADEIRAGYPLGKTAERYHLCHNSSDTEEVGYYYVDHPAGDYCESKP